MAECNRNVNLFSIKAFLEDLVLNPKTPSEVKLNFLAKQVSTSTQIGYMEYIVKDYRSALIQYGWASDKIDACKHSICYILC